MRTFFTPSNLLRVVSQAFSETVTSVTSDEIRSALNSKEEAKSKTLFYAPASSLDMSQTIGGG